MISRNGHGCYPLDPPKVMGSREDRYGYVTVLITINNRWRPHGVHALVCEAFHGLRPTPLHQAAHDDGVRNHNIPENLAWKTALEQAADRERHGHTARGEGHRSNLTAINIVDIRSRFRPGLGALLADEFGVTRQAIHAIVHRKVWKHV